MHSCTPANSIFDGPITYLLLILRSFIEIFSPAHAQAGKGSMISNLALSLIVFRVIVAASVAVKGLSTLSAVYWFHEATPCEQANLSFLGDT